MIEPSILMCGITSSVFFERQYIIIGEDTHELESRIHADLGDHDREAEDLFNLCGSSRVKIQS